AASQKSDARHVETKSCHAALPIKLIGRLSTVRPSLSTQYFQQDAEKARQRRSRIAQSLNVRQGSTCGEGPIRSHVIEASGSSEAWYVPPRLFACCGLAERSF
ncbi:MAG: hypothetical protein AAB433_02125, partial [Nitrospirota bacterium]